MCVHLLYPLQVRKISFSEEEFRRGLKGIKEAWTGGSKGGGGGVPAAEKYSRILQPPLPVLAGHDCDGKPEEKELQAGLLCQWLKRLDTIPWL